MLTFTRERLIDVSPVHEFRKEQMREILELGIEDRICGLVVIRCFEALIKWYRRECKVIGEQRAFWGLVYRITDNPTAEDIVTITDWVNFEWRFYNP